VYWTEGQFSQLQGAPPGKLFSKGPLPWRLLAYLLKLSPEVSRIRTVIRKRLMDEPRIRAGEGPWFFEVMTYRWCEHVGPGREGDIGEYSGERKQVRPVTIATYQMLTHALPSVTRQSRARDLSIFALNDWGLIIYDEVHLLPAPVFRLAAAIQTTKRLGLTATLVREDHREGDVFALIGPTRYQAGWKVLERAGWIAEAKCHEVRVALGHDERMAYVQARKPQQARIAGENARKLPVVQTLVKQHLNDRVLVIGQYLNQLKHIAAVLRAPFIYGAMANDERNQLYDQFRRGEITLLVVSKVANYAVDLPDANVAIQVSGTFGSRQEEAQRLGRILRPKSGGEVAHFYTLVTRDTREQDFAHHRQLFLTEQGYSYQILDGGEMLERRHLAG